MLTSCYESLVDTDTGRLAVDLLKLKHLELGTVEDSARGYLAVVDRATKVDLSGHFVSAKDGTDLPW